MTKLSVLSLLLCIGFLPGIFAQGNLTVNASYDTTLWYQNNHVFEHIDPMRIPSGILLDYGIQFTDLSRFDGSSITDSNVVSFGILEQINSTLYTGTIRPVRDRPMHPDSLYANLRRNTQVNHLKLSGLLYTYQQYDPKKTGLVKVDGGQLYDNFSGDKWLDPYQTKTVFAMALPLTQIHGNHFKVSLPANLWQTNFEDVQRIEFDADDGNGWQVIAPDDELDVIYEVSGLKHWHFKVHTLESVFESQGIINIIPMSATADQVLTISGTKPFQGHTNSARVSIDYAAGHTGIEKPLIIVEGFEPGEIVAPEDEFGIYDMQDQFEVALLNLLTSNPLITELDNGNYDRIYVDWNQGTDYLERNAYLLEDIIKWVNENKTGTAQNVVWGFSMGGVIARYALKDLEDESYDHEVRLFISHDAPHQGANAPIGAQALLQHMKTFIFNAGVLNSPLVLTTVPSTGSAFLTHVMSLAERPAAAEMLINQFNLSLNAVHSAWQSELQTKGYPSACRNVAIANGSECGISRPFPPGATLMNISGHANTGWAVDMILFGANMLFPQLSPLVAGGVAPTLSALGISPFLFFLPGSNQMDVDFKIRGNKHLSVSQVYYGDITYTKNFSGLFNITVDATKMIVTQSNNYDWDRLPSGGYATDIVTNGIPNPTGNALGGYDVNWYAQPSFSFVFTPSALDIGSGTGGMALARTAYDRQYIGAFPPTGSLASPFDNFVTGFSTTNLYESNEDHIRITSRNAEFAGKEMANAPGAFSCANACLDKEISGDEFMCHYSSATFSFPYDPYTGNSILWTASPSGVVTLNQSNGTCYVSSGAASGTVTLTAAVHTDCGTVTFSKEIMVGGVFEIALSTPSSTNSTFTAAVTPALSGNTYQWSDDDGLTWGSITPSYDRSFYKLPENAPHKKFRVRVFGPGCSAPQQELIEYYMHIGMLPQGYSSKLEEADGVYPNPTTDNWMITSATNETSVYTLFDMKGAMMIKETAFQYRAEIPGALLAKGVYILKVTSGTATKIYKLVKE